MGETASNWNFERVELDLPASLPMDADQFFDFCQANRDLHIERTARGKIVVMPPVGGYTGHQSLVLSAQVGDRAERDGTGVGFGSRTVFTLPFGAVRAPSVAWVQRSRFADLTLEQKQKFLPLCPDFVTELRGTSDRLVIIREKMQEFMDNGARLGFLVDPQRRQVTVYRPGVEPEVLDALQTVSGDPELPGFTLDMARIWNPGF